MRFENTSGVAGSIKIKVVNFDHFTGGNKNERRN